MKTYAEFLGRKISRKGLQAGELGYPRVAYIRECVVGPSVKRVPHRKVATCAPEIFAVFLAVAE